MEIICGSLTRNYVTTNIKIPLVIYVLFSMIIKSLINFNYHLIY